MASTGFLLSEQDIVDQKDSLTRGVELALNDKDFQALVASKLRSALAFAS